MATLELASPLYVNFFHTAGSPEGLLQDGKKQVKCSVALLQFQIPGITFTLYISEL